jgi:hypothetical protein
MGLRGASETAGAASTQALARLPMPIAATTPALATKHLLLVRQIAQ